MDNPATKCSKKIDIEGNYCSFPGLTVTASIKKDLFPFWQKVEQTFKTDKLITSYFSILPHQSYHVTTMNLYCKRNLTDEAWNKEVSDQGEFFRKLHRQLEESTFSPEIQIESICLGRTVILLQASFPSSQSDVIYRIEKQFDLVGKVPKEFHMTLGYRFKNIPEQELNELSEKIHGLYLQLFSEKQKKITLNPPQLSYFHDMTAFFPWNGEENPF